MAQDTNDTVSLLSFVRQNSRLVLAELVLLGVAMALNVAARLWPGPWPGDVASVLGLQHLLLQHKTLTLLLEQISAVTWPIPALISISAIALALVLLRRWLDVGVIAVITSLGSGSMYLTNQLIQRPRPHGYGIYVQQQIVAYYSFPSGHVQHVLTFFGLLLFMTYQTRQRAWWLWLLRAILLAMLVLIGPARILAGEHWTSDVVQGLIYGAFWLILGISLYTWAAHRWPRLLARDERTPRRRVISASQPAACGGAAAVVAAADSPTAALHMHRQTGDHMQTGGLAQRHPGTRERIMGGESWPSRTDERQGGN